MGFFYGLYAIGSAVFLYIILLSVQFLLSWNGPREPPIIQPNFPLFGHAIGLFVHGVRYFEQLG